MKDLSTSSQAQYSCCTLHKQLTAGREQFGMEREMKTVLWMVNLKNQKHDTTTTRQTQTLKMATKHKENSRTTQH